MANNLSNYLENKLLDHSLGLTSYTKPSTWVALFTADPGETGDQTNEVPTGRGYARQALTIDAAAAGATQNDGALAFGPCTGSGWGTVTHVAVVDNATIAAGNVLWYGPLAASKVIAVGDSFSIADADLDFSMD